MRKIVLSVFMVLLLCFQVVAQNQRVSGTVTDQSGETVIGATVRLKGTDIAIGTNTDGQYSINAPANGVLEFSFVGMKTQEHSVGGRTVIDVVLEPDTETIETLVFIGYGSGNEISNVVGSNVSLSGADLASRPSPNVADAMQGKVAGMQSWMSSGEPTATASIRIRGISSISLSSAPLYILDGMPVTASVFNTLNAYDIENVTVLKDAASTAIYGSRAANGVIYITSKRGRKGMPPKLNINAYYGISFKTNSPLRLMNAKELIEWEDKIFPDIASTPENQRVREEVLNYGLDFNWENYIMDSSAPNYNLNAEVVGGSDNVRYLFSFGYFNKKGTNVKSSMDRYNFRSNIDADITKTLRIASSLSLTALWSETAVTGWYLNSPTGDIYSQLPYRPPFEHDIVNGELQWGRRLDRYPWSGFVDQFFYFDKHPSSSRRIDMAGSITEDWRPIKGLTIKAVQAMDGVDSFAEAMVYPSYEGGATGIITNRFTRRYNLIATNTIDYKHTFGENHNLSLLLGQEANVYKYSHVYASGQGLADDRMMTHDNVASGRSVTSNEGLLSEYVFNSYFFSADYNYANKYYLTGVVRRDGSSRFGPENQWGNFYTVGAMWDMKKESFLQDASAIDMLRLKVNYGELGNANLPDYQWRAVMGTDAGSTYDGNIAMTIMTPGNSGLSWETLAEFTASISTRLFDRVNFTFDWYNKTTYNMLNQEPLSAATGFTYGWTNIGDMRNRGIELDLAVDLVSTKDFYWGLNANASYNKNKILRLVTPIYSDVVYQQGGSMGDFWQVERVGVDPYDGRLIWRTPDGELTKNQLGLEGYEATHEGLNYYADWSGGFGTALTWKNLSLNLDFVWCGPKYILVNEYFYSRNTAGGFQHSNQEYWMMDMWTEPWQVTQVAKQGTPFQGDTSLFSNAAFLRLKNVTLAYTIPERLIERTNGAIKGARVYFTGRNLLTFTTFQGLDPEFDSAITQFEYPNSREITFGLEITF